MNLRSVTFRRPAVLAVIAGVVLALLWWKFAWEPQGAELSSARRDQQQESANLYTAGQKLGHLKHLAAIAPKLSALDQKLAAAAPPADELNTAIEALNTAADSAGVTLKSLSPGQLGSAAGLAPIPVSLAVSGDYLSIQQFLDELKTASRLFVVDGLTESAAGGASGSLAISATVTGHLLSGLAPSPVLPGVTGPAPAPAPSPPGAKIAPTGNGVISGPVNAARNAVSAANSATAQAEAQTSATGG